MSADDLAARFVRKIPGRSPEQPPSITIAGVPPYVTRTQVLHAVNSLGLNPEELAGLEFRHDVIYVTVHATDARGWRYAEGRGLDDGTFNARPDEVATHRIAIPIVDEAPG